MLFSHPLPMAVRPLARSGNRLPPAGMAGARSALTSWRRCGLALTAALALLLPAADVRAQGLPAVTRLTLAADAATSAAGSEAPRARPAESGTPAKQAAAAPPPARELAAEPPPEPSEFERLARDANGGRPLWRLGARTRFGDGSLAHLETPARVPPHYVVQVGDELSVTAWGSLDAQWQLRVDRAGRVTLPRVGPVAVAGSTAAELAPLLRARLERVYKGFELAAAVTDVTPVRIQITGFVERPGDHVVPGLTTISGALTQVQGPAAGGSFRRIKLLREGKAVAEFDLYALLRDGGRRDDRLLQPGDVLYIDAVGPQVAVLGSVNRAAVFEFLPGETVASVLQLAGGFSSVADRRSITIERLGERSSVGAVALNLPQDSGLPLQDGDILRVKSQVSANGPSQLKNKRVTVDGEVRQPGDYLLPPGATLADAVAAAGGATPSAFLFGTALRRDSVRVTQEANYERALRELETGLARSAANRASSDDRSADAETSIRQLMARLRSNRPEGRVVLDITPQTTTLPAVALEDGDQLTLPPANQSVGVFGSVYYTGSFLHSAGSSLGAYIQRAGGPTSGADYGAAFVVRANGSVLSAAQGDFWGRARQFEARPALPGDTVFVPEELFRLAWVQGAKDWTQILYQLGVGLAALRTIR
jgi:protein involved in polysaccharide export with SLBB domain